MGRSIRAECVCPLSSNMTNFRIYILCSLLVTSVYANPTRQIREDDYWAQRQAIIDAEKGEQLGASIQLTDDEIIANELLMKYKYEELDAAFEDPDKFIPSHHFFETQARFADNQIYAILREMPKGGLLHTHDTATTGWDYLYRQTFRPNLYLCNETTQPARLRFFDVPDATCTWRLLQDVRDEGGDAFEVAFRQQLTLVRDSYHKDFSDVNKVWSTFQNIFILVTDMLIYRPVFEDQFYTTLLELYEDNVTYLEFRGTLDPVYELDGRVYTPEEVVGIYVQVAERFKTEHPHFIGVKLIYAPLRLVEDAKIKEYIANAKRIKAAFPDFVAGFDLVGQEDLGRPTIEYVNMLKDFDMDFYFHAGETNWNQGETDLNLLDAILLGTKRIGHGYALIKHPELMRLVIQRKIALEVSPISNQVLSLVSDLRNHPASIYMANNIPMVITNDDPTYWGAQGLSYDWYMAFVGISSRTADLRLLKQLAINSLQYSAMNDTELHVAMVTWNSQWDAFIKRFISQ